MDDFKLATASVDGSGFVIYTHGACGSVVWLKQEYLKEPGCPICQRTAIKKTG